MADQKKTLGERYREEWNTLFSKAQAAANKVRPKTGKGKKGKQVKAVFNTLSSVRPSSFVTALVGVGVALVVMIGVFLPTLNTAVNTLANNNQTTEASATLASFLPLIMLLGGVMVLVNNLF
jgi:hypothetical protein